MDELLTPAGRREVLRRVDVRDPRAAHGVLREVFEYELAWREGDDDGVDDEFENIYLCAYLLYLIGDPADAPRLYRAKFGTRDFDLGSGFAAEAIFGAGTTATVDWLRAHGFADEADELTEWLAGTDPSDIADWAAHQRDYFYSPEGDLLLDPL